MMACGTAFAQQGKIASGPYKGPVVPMAAPETPDAAPFFSNFSVPVDPCTTCNYDFNNGYLVLGPNNCFPPTAGATQWLAYPFVAGHTGTTRQVTLAITNDSALCTPTSSKFQVDIYTDNCTGLPGSSLGTATATAASAPCLTARARLAVNLTQGAKYWVVVTTNTSPAETGTTAVWWETVNAISDFNLNDGNGWIFNPPGSPGAFSVQ
jgi:hypothetical protein